MPSLLPHFKRKLIMATMNANSAAALINAALAGNTSAKEEKQQAMVYLNVGVTIPMPNAEGEVVDTFVSLPFGLPLDTMAKMVARGNNAHWNAMVDLKNGLLEALTTLGNAQEAGTGKVLPKLEVQIFHRKEASEPAAPSANSMELILKALSA